jgi:hypothetical protein
VFPGSIIHNVGGDSPDVWAGAGALRLTDADCLDRSLRPHPFQEQTVASPHIASDSFSPLFSNVTTEQSSPMRLVRDATAARKRSEPDGDHHLTFVDLADSAAPGDEPI